MNPSINAAARLVDVPDGSVVEFGITVVSYLDEEGESMFGFKVHGDPAYSTVVGLLHMVAFELIREANPDPDS